jgi:hypothetical protein
MWFRGRGTGWAVTLVFVPLQVVGVAAGFPPVVRDGCGLWGFSVPWGFPGSSGFPVGAVGSDGRPVAVGCSDAVGSFASGAVVAGREAPSSLVPVPSSQAVRARAARATPVVARRRVRRKLRMAETLSNKVG